MTNSTHLAPSPLEDFSKGLIGLPVNHVWRGYGSAIFLECGPLSPRVRRDGSPGEPQGAISLMIEWSWRIEGKRTILCGSWSDEAKWPKNLARLLNTRVVNMALLGRLNEIDVELSNGIHVVSFSTTEGDPQWALIDRQVGSLYVRHGRLRVEPPGTPRRMLPEKKNP